MEGKREDELNCPVCRCKFTLDKEGKVSLFDLLHKSAYIRKSSLFR